MIEESVHGCHGTGGHEVTADMKRPPKYEDGPHESAWQRVLGLGPEKPVSEGGLGKSAPAPEQGPEEKAEETAESPADPLQAMEAITAEHRRLWGLISRKLELGLRKRDPKKGLEHLKAIKLAGDILSVVVRGQRQAWGLEALEGSLAPDDTEEIIEEMASLTATSGADKALDRG
jgi:hypothetical protein